LYNIKALRERVNLSQTALAERLKVSQQAIAKWESGTASPRADKLPELARILGCTVDELLRPDKEELPA